MKNNDLILGSLAMDLQRVAIGYHRGSDKMAARFAEETKRWQQEIDRSKLPGYIIRILDQLELLLKNEDTQLIADRVLMYSILLQNFVRTQKS